MRRRAEAFAVKDGRFVTVGSTDEVRNLITPRTDVIDAEGMTVTPGFIDAHCHPSGVRELSGVDLGNARTIADVQQITAAESPGSRPAMPRSPSIRCHRKASSRMQAGLALDAALAGDDTVFLVRS
ncbi:MAG: amidohydrolase family protein [Luteitalea sp.]|nr:amidohydrolase family protein [Luteitalea sp.]